MTDIVRTVFTPKDALWLVPKLCFILICIGASFMVAGTVASLGYEQLVTDGSAFKQSFEKAQSGDISFWLVALGLAFVFIQNAGLPALGAAIVAALIGLRSWFGYAFMGLVIGLALPAFLLAAETIARNEWPIFATAGMAGGLTYWLLAGAWLRLVTPPAPTKA
jgi:hypothetical protein